MALNVTTNYILVGQRFTSQKFSLPTVMENTNPTMRVAKGIH